MTLTPLATLRQSAETLGQSLPPLLAEAERLAAHVMLGEHGRRRAGQGEDFWQYRPAMAGDGTRMIDWRRSARSDQAFVREREWQAAQSVSFWVDPARSMAFSGDKSRGSKGDRARVIALALGILLLRGGERVGLLGAATPPRSGRAQVMPLAQSLLPGEGDTDYGAPTAKGVAAHGRVVFLSDFLGAMEPLEQAMAEAADRGARGVIIHILDPVEEAFPFKGRTVFDSMGGTLRHETQDAGDLRDRYLARLAERKDHVTQLAGRLGWRAGLHHTDRPAQEALLWAYRALQGGR